MICLHKIFIAGREMRMYSMLYGIFRDRRYAFFSLVHFSPVLCTLCARMFDLK